MKHADTIKRLAALLLSAVMLLSLAACGGGNDTAEATTAAAGTAEETTAAETETTAATPDLPELDLEGATITILAKVEIDVKGQWSDNDLCVSELNGDILNDAAFERNRLVEEKFNFVFANGRMPIGGQYSYSMHQGITKLILAGDSTYDIVFPTIRDSAYLARDGMLHDLGTEGYVDLDKPWWNQQFTEDTMVGGKSHYANGDVMQSFMRSVYTILFNKKIINDINLENPYDLVRDYEWTMDKMLELGEAFSADMNGDGVIKDDDHVGLLTLNNQVEALYTASGCKLVTVDGTNFTFTGNSEKSLNVFQRIFDLWENREVVICSTDVTRRGESTKSMSHNDASAAAFAADCALFILGTMNNVPRMRNMETDFGILPLPMSADGQDSYYSYVQTWASGSAAVTITATDVDRSTIILEEMAYQSRELTTPAYYEVSLKTKYARDEESAEMLDIIYDARTCDLGNLYNIGNIVSEITTRINNRQDGFASFMESKVPLVESTLLEISEAYNK